MAASGGASSPPEEDVGAVLEMEIGSTPSKKGEVVSVRALGEESGGTFVALGGLGRRGMGPDWLRAGIPQLLADQGWRVLLPDPYTCARTRPSLGEVMVPHFIVHAIEP